MSDSSFERRTNRQVLERLISEGSINIRRSPLFERVPPFGQTVGLVDHQVADREEGEEGIRLEHWEDLRCGEEDLHPSTQAPAKELPSLPRRLSAPEGAAGDTPGSETPEVVVHQGEEGDDYEGEPGEDGGGQGEAESLPSACGENHKLVRPVEGVGHHVELDG